MKKKLKILNMIQIVIVILNVQLKIVKIAPKIRINVINVFLIMPLLIMMYIIAC